MGLLEQAFDRNSGTTPKIGDVRPGTPSGSMSAYNPGSLTTADTSDLVKMGGFDKTPRYMTPAEAEASAQMLDAETQLLASTKQGHQNIVKIAQTRTKMVQSNLKARAAMVKEHEKQYGYYVNYLRAVYKSGVMMHAMNTKIATIIDAARQRIEIQDNGLKRAKTALSDWSDKIKA